MKKNWIKKLLIILTILVLFIVICIFIIANFSVGSFAGVQQITINEFVKGVEQKIYQNILIFGQSIEGYTNNGTIHETILPNPLNNWVGFLIEHNVSVRIVSISESARFMTTYKVLSILGSILEPVAFFIMIIWLNKRFVGSIGQSEADFIVPTITFKDVAGLAQAKLELQETIDFFRHPKKFLKLGCRVPKGILLVGPPGNGKTMIAKALAGESGGIKFLHTTAASFIEIFVGTGPKKIRQLFQKARENSPCIIFIDEFDSIGSRGQRNGHNESDNTINQLLTELDGINSNENIVVIAATNHMDKIDPAVLRPGRFDRTIHINDPDIYEREELLDLCLKSIPVDFSVSNNFWAKITSFFSRAAITHLINEAKIFAVRNNMNYLNNNHMRSAFDKIVLGIPGRIDRSKPEEVRSTAIHEAGHAYVMHHFAHILSPVYKATIVPHGGALGLVMPTNHDHKHLKKIMECDVMIFFAGRLSEEILLNIDNTGIGCCSDLAKARQIAERYVKYGLKKERGLSCIASNESELSEKEKAEFYTQVDKLLKTLEKKTRDMIKKGKNDILLIAEHLIVRETLTGEEIELLLSRKILLPTVVKRYKAIALFYA